MKNNDDQNGLLFLILMGLGTVLQQNGKPVTVAVKRRRSIGVKFYMAFLSGLAAMYTHWVFDAPRVETVLWFLVALLIAKAWQQLSTPIVSENEKPKPDSK